MSVEVALIIHYTRVLRRVLTYRVGRERRRVKGCSFSSRCLFDWERCEKKGQSHFIRMLRGLASRLPVRRTGGKSLLLICVCIVLNALFGVFKVLLLSCFVGQIGGCDTLFVPFSRLLTTSIHTLIVYI